MRLIYRTVATLVVLGAIAAASKAQIAYAVASDQGLYRIDVTSAQLVLVGGTGVDMRGLAIAPDGQMYGTSNVGDLYKINAATAQATLIDRVRDESIESLDFEDGNDGVHLWGVNVDGQPTYYEIDRLTAGPIKVRKITQDMGPIRATAWVPDPNTRLFLSMGDQPQVQTAWLAAPDVVQAQQIGPIGQSPGLVRGIDYTAGNELFGLTDNGFLVRFNPNSGEVVDSAFLAPIEWYDMSFGTPVPEPATLAGLVVGALALGRARRRR